MEKRENEIDNSHIRFTGDDIELAAKMLDKLTSTIEIVYYLLDRGDERAFVMMLLSAKDVDMNTVLKEQKRDTDILFEIDREASIYAIVCQDTKIDGGYHFAERVLQSLISHKAEEIYCTELEIKTTTYDIKYIIFKLVENYIKIKADKREGEIVFKTLH
jgi:recombinational DNA repair protein RecR